MGQTVVCANEKSLGQLWSAEAAAQFDRVVTALEAKLAAAAEHLAHAREDLLTFTALPREIWCQVWSSNPQERLNRELRRHIDAVSIFPARTSISRLASCGLTYPTWRLCPQSTVVGIPCPVVAPNNNVKT
jgi:Transposase, Mutator family